MTEQGYGSLEACKRLAGAGIVMETEAVWAEKLYTWQTGPQWSIIEKPIIPWKTQYPAPSMEKVWRELPDLVDAGELRIIRIIHSHETVVYYGWIDDEGKEQSGSRPFRNANPTDALIDLLIWVEGKEDKS